MNPPRSLRTFSWRCRPVYLPIVFAATLGLLHATLGVLDSWLAIAFTAKKFAQPGELAQQLVEPGFIRPPDHSISKRYVSRPVRRAAWHRGRDSCASGMPCEPAWYRSTANTTLTSGLIFECTQKECPDPVAMNRRIRDALVG